MTKDLFTGFSNICVIIGLIDGIYFQIRKSHSHGIVKPEEILNATSQEQVYLFSDTSSIAPKLIKLSSFG